VRLVRVREAAEALGVSTQHVYHMARQGILPPGVVVRLGRQVRVDADALEAWVKAGGSAADATKTVAAVAEAFRELYVGPVAREHMTIRSLGHQA
jgi:excisionase family DNA binding protein